jgi:hypothetical protein
MRFEKEVDCLIVEWRLIWRIGGRNIIGVRCAVALYIWLTAFFAVLLFTCLCLVGSFAVVVCRIDCVSQLTLLRYCMTKFLSDRACLAQRSPVGPDLPCCLFSFVFSICIGEDLLLMMVRGIRVLEFRAAGKSRY